MTDKLPRIFVQIASYRDPECQWTIKDIFEKAVHPDRITVGVCWQYIPGEDDGLLVNNLRPEQVRIMEVPAAESSGVCWARRETQKLWQGEEYTLVTDSHMRFIPGWDDALIAQLHACPSAKPVLSCNPASYTPPNNLQPNPKIAIRRAGFFTNAGEMRCKGVAVEHKPDAPLNGAFIAAGLIFSRSNLIEEVPYDPLLYFNQEEITYAARMWTHGWDVFHPNEVIAYHYYVTAETRAEKPLHWRDNAEWVKAQQLGRARYQHLFRQALSSDPEVTRDLEEFGMGKARGLDDFERYCGVNFREAKLTERALRCTFIEGLETWMPNGVRIQELDGPTPDAASAAQLIPQESLPPLAFVPSAPAPEPTPYVPPAIITRGDFIPFFVLPNQHGEEREFHAYGGKPAVLLLLPPTDDAISKNYHAYKKQLGLFNRHDISFIMVVSPGRRNLATLHETLGMQQSLWIDGEGTLAHALGLTETKGQPILPTAVTLTPNLKVRSIIRHESADFDLEALGNEAALLREEASRATPQAPVLIVPEVLSPELCAELIETWKNGNQFKGRVSTRNSSAVKASAKIRTDVMVPDGLLERVDATLARTLFPEIEKVFDVKVAHRERYKIGCYSARDGGFFRPHRDNHDVLSYYRRVAMTLNLNSEFTGGELIFPEYGEHRYKPTAGSAVIFPCDLMHQATKVTEGDRFMLVTFMYEAKDEPIRVYQRRMEGQPDNFKDYTIHVPTEAYPDVRVRKTTPYPSHDSLENAAQPVALPPVPRPAIRPVTRDMPPELLVVDGYLSPDRCKKLADFADAKTAHALNVVDPAKSTSGKMVTHASSGRVTENIYIDDHSPEILSIFLDIYGHQLQPHYGVKFEWFERPQILKYGPGGKYDRHADAEHLDKETHQWVRALDRDYSVLLYLNDEYEGGEIDFPSFNYKIKPSTGMLIAFPSDHRYLHAALPVLSGKRYVIVSWAAVLGKKRVRDSAPYASVFMNIRRNQSG